MKKVLTINSGSSSLKFQLFEMPKKEVIASGQVERIGLKGSIVSLKTHHLNTKETLDIKDHKAALEEVTRLLLNREIGVIKNVENIKIIAHRVVHGGITFTKTTEINTSVKEKIRDLFSLAPLHNPPNLKGIEVTEVLFPKAKQVAVFDTSFTKTLPEKVYRYALDRKLTDENHIRVYGFHGISHQYVSKKAYQFLGDSTQKIISIHLGNGCSMTAIDNGIAIDHTLGYGPNDGLIMGTRCGSVDSTAVLSIMNHQNYTPDEMATVLSKKSGMLGLTGHIDMRDIETMAMDGDLNCKLALEMNAYRIKKYIGAYAAAMNGLDALVFTAGIGENSDIIRGMACSDLDFMGIVLDKEKNKVRSKDIRDISSSKSHVRILIVPTNEELEMAEEAYAL